MELAFPDDGPGPACCLGAAGSRMIDRTTLPMKPLGDAEGLRLPEALPPVIDAHVHLFPDRVFDSLWRWFDEHAWPIRYQLRTPQIVQFLLSRGVQRIVALHYSHRPGMARVLNQYVAEVARLEPRVIGLATVLPGEPGAVQILEEAFALGLKGVKLHCHVQRFEADAPELEEIYATCARHRKPMVMHAGREPAIPAYGVDPYALCGAERVERVLQRHPSLSLCVPHLGVDEFDAYEKLLERHANLWLDTTMVVAGYFPIEVPERLIRARPDRILYGSDFPSLPYAWDREVKKLTSLKLPEEHLAKLLGQNALTLFNAVA